MWQVGYDDLFETALTLLPYHWSTLHAAIRFFDEVANIAEEEGHHPDLHLTDYREAKVDITACLHDSQQKYTHWLVLTCGMQVQVSTHAIKGLSLFDVILAAKIDALPVEYSPKWLREQKH